jgi:hypothetical protein
MSGLSVNSLNNYYASIFAQNSSSTSQSELQSLGQALQSGNLPAAQTAFTALQKNYQSQNPSTQSATTSNPVATDLTNLASALSSGSLSTAQSVYTQLQKDMQTQGGGHHHHHHGGGMGGAVQSLVSQLSSSSSTGGSTSVSSGTLDVQA